MWRQWVSTKFLYPESFQTIRYAYYRFCTRWWTAYLTPTFKIYLTHVKRNGSPAIFISGSCRFFFIFFCFFLSIVFLPPVPRASLRCIYLASAQENQFTYKFNILFHKLLLPLFLFCGHFTGKILSSHWTEIKYGLTVSLLFLFIKLKYHYIEHMFVLCQTCRFTASISDKADLLWYGASICQTGCQKQLIFLLC